MVKLIFLLMIANVSCGISRAASSLNVEHFHLDIGHGKSSEHCHRHVVHLHDSSSGSEGKGKEGEGLIGQGELTGVYLNLGVPSKDKLALSSLCPATTIVDRSIVIKMEILINSSRSPSSPHGPALVHATYRILEAELEEDKGAAASPLFRGFFERAPAEITDIPRYVAETITGEGKSVLADKVRTLLSNHNEDLFAETTGELRQKFINGGGAINCIPTVPLANHRIIHALSRQLAQQIYAKSNKQEFLKNPLFQRTLPLLSLAYRLGQGVEKDTEKADFLTKYILPEEEEEGGI